MSTAGSVDVFQTCDAPANTRVVVQVIGGSGKTQVRAPLVSCYAYARHVGA